MVPTYPLIRGDDLRSGGFCTYFIFCAIIIMESFIVRTHTRSKLPKKYIAVSVSHITTVQYIYGSIVARWDISREEKERKEKKDDSDEKKLERGGNEIGDCCSVTIKKQCPIAQLGEREKKGNSTPFWGGGGGRKIMDEIPHPPSSLKSSSYFIFFGYCCQNTSSRAPFFFSLSIVGSLPQYKRFINCDGDRNTHPATCVSTSVVSRESKAFFGRVTAVWKQESPWRPHSS